MNEVHDTIDENTEKEECKLTAPEKNNGSVNNICLMEEAYNQFMAGLYSGIPKPLADRCEEKGINIHDEIKKLILSYYVMDSKEKSGILFLKLPEASVYYNHTKRFNRSAQRLYSTYQMDREAFVAGRKGSEFSPFDAVSIAIKNGFITAEEVLKKADEAVNEWFSCSRDGEHMRNSKALDMSRWMGVTDFPYIGAYKNDRQYKRYCKLDINDYTHTFAMRNVPKYLYVANILMHSSMFASGTRAAAVRQSYRPVDRDDSGSGNVITVLSRDLPEKAPKQQQSLDLKVAGRDEYRVLAYILTAAVYSYQERGEFVATGTLADLCAVVGQKSDSTVIKRTKAAVETLRNIVFWVKESMTSASLFSRVTTEWTSREKQSGERENRFAVSIGSVLADDIINWRISMVNLQEWHALDKNKTSGLAALLYPTFRRDRISARLERHEQSTTYTYLELSLIAKALGRTKHERELAYVRAIEAMKSEGILIQDYRYIGKQRSKDIMVTITWFPMSQPEMDDITVVDKILPIS